MKGKILALTALAGAVLPFAVNEYFNSRCPALPKGIVKENRAFAVPSFARQTGFSCSTCHTIPPRLNRYGMIFKMRGYTEGKSIGSIVTGEGETILKYNPVSIRVYSVPYSKKKGEDREVIFPDEFVVAFAGRVAENVGTFASFASEEGEPFEPEIVKVAITKDFGTAIVGLVGGKTSPTGTDPFESLNVYSRITRFKTTVWESVRKDKGIPDIWDLKNYGASAYAYIANMVYVNAGVYTGIVKDSSGVINKGKSDPFDFYGRIAFAPSNLPADINIGAFYYAGKDKDPTTDQTLVKPHRMGIDLGVLYNIGDIGIELNGLYVDAKDKFTSNPDFKHRGFNLMGTLYWKYRLGLSLLYGNYKYKSDNPLTTGNNEEGVKRTDTTVHVSYLIRPNVRLGAEYTTTNYSGANAPEDIHLTSLILDFAF